MSFRGVLKSCAPLLLSDIYSAQKQIAPLYADSKAASWFSALLPRTRRALQRSNFALLPVSLRRGMGTVVDIGANEGQWITSFLTLVPVSRIFIFEPNPAAMRLCKQKLMRRPGVIFNEAALGPAPGTATLHISNSCDFSSLLTPNHELIEANYARSSSRTVAEQTVQVLPLDQVLPAGEQIDLMKLDVQGFERQVLAGAAESLQRTRAVLAETNFQSHYLGDDTFDSLFRLFTRDLNFRLWDLSSAFHGTTGQALWADALFVNPKLVEPR